MSLQDKASIVLPKGFAGKAGTLECWNPNSDSLVGLSVVRATTATRVNESGLIESVAANVPRRDFTNGGCGDLLVEPQRTNLLTYSEQFDNAAWSKTGAAITANSTTSPKGDTTADTLTGNGTQNFIRVSWQNVTLPSAGVYRLSVFAKKGTNDFININFEGYTGASGTIVSFFDLANGTTPTTGASIIDYGNGWYRCVSPPCTIDPSDLTGNIVILSTPSTSSVFFASAGDANGKSVEIFGAQLEQGSYATSYIPTVASAVTRNADVISGTGLAALLGDSAGGIYIRGRVFDASVSNVIEISNSSDAANERVLIDTNSTNITGKTTDGGVEQATLNASGATNNTEFAVCYNYALNSFSIQKDGTTAATDSAGTTPSGLDQIRFTDGSTPFCGRISELVIFNQRPDNTQGEAVTA